MSIYEKVVGMDTQMLMGNFLKNQADLLFTNEHNLMRETGLDECRTFLDIGTGDGYYLRKVASRHPAINFKGMDFKKEAIEQAKKKTAEQSVRNITWVVDDITDQTQGFHSQKKELYDGILMRFVDAHLTDLEKHLAYLKRLLCPGGRLWIISLDLYCMSSSTHPSEFNVYKECMKRFYQTFGIDGDLGTKYGPILRKLGFDPVIVKPDKVSNREADIQTYQNYVLHETELFRKYDPNSVSDEELERIIRFVEDIVPSQEYEGTLGGSMIFAKS